MRAPTSGHGGMDSVVASPDSFVELDGGLKVPRSNQRFKKGYMGAFAPDADRLPGAGRSPLKGFLPFKPNLSGWPIILKP